MIAEGLSVNQAGHLVIGGCDTVELAEQYGTPLYVMDEDIIRANCRAFYHSMEEYYGGNGRVAYASKAFCCMEMCRIVAEEGLGLDVVSGGELYTAKKAGFPMDKIYFHGNNKTLEELRFALREEVGRIVVDNLTELHLLQKAAEQAGKSANIMLRIKPGIDAHTHQFIRTGQIDSKFGFALENGEALAAVKEAVSCPNILLKGLHCHIGSQIFDLSPFELAAEVMLRFAGRLSRELQVTVTELNLGGGFGIRYQEGDDAKPYGDFMKKVSAEVKRVCEEENLPVPFVVIEPGRSVVGPAGTTLYRVGSVKEIEGVRNYVSVDGGMTDNPRYALYQAPYTLCVANRANAGADYTATIAGKCCESGDLIQEHTQIQRPQAGDLLAVFCTGAYNYSMASLYNRTPRPAVVMVKEGQSRVIVRRESYDDLIRNDL